MARGYPRFLFSNPTNTKSEGPFIVHTLFPKFIAKVIIDFKPTNIVMIEILNQWDSAPESEFAKATEAAQYWIKSQVSQAIYKINNPASTSTSEYDFFRTFILQSANH